MAVALFKLGEQRPALHQASLAIHANPAGEWGHRLRSVILLEKGDIRGALEAAQEAAARAPNDVKVIHNLISTLLRAGRVKEAAQGAEHLRRIAPSSPLSYEALALVALRQNRWIEAEIHCRAMLRINPLSYALLSAAPNGCRKPLRASWKPSG